MSLLMVDDLRVEFHTDDGVVRAVDGVSFEVDRGETVCIVGESGAGKSVTVEALTRLFRSPPGRIAGGSVRFDGVDLAALPEERLREYRGGRVAYVFQNPQSSLNPVYTVGWQIREAVQLHSDVSREEADDVAADLLDRVGIPEPRTRLGDHPHQLSGGMKQRVAIAMALAGEPDLLVADEPTTALDVTIQAQILDLLRDLQEETGTSMLWVTHDLGVVSEVADRVVVMYAGRVMETAGVADAFERPAHPYTRALLGSLPGRGGRRLEGGSPDPLDPPPGCRFHPRCPHSVDDCERGGPPATLRVREGQTAACVYYGAGYDASELDAPAGGTPSAGGEADG